MQSSEKINGQRAEISKQKSLIACYHRVAYELQGWSNEREDSEDSDLLRLKCLLFI